MGYLRIVFIDSAADGMIIAIKKYMINLGKVMKHKIEQVLKQGVLEHSKGNIAKAIRHYKEILIYYPQNSEVNHNLGIIYFNAGKNKKSLNLFKRAINSSNFKCFTLLRSSR